jgi:hypothetical protein
VVVCCCTLLLEGAGQSSIFAIKLVGSGLSATTFTATPSCPPYARLTLQQPATAWTCVTCSAFPLNWIVSDLVYSTQSVSAPAVPANCASPFQSFVASQGGIYITRSGEYRATSSLTFNGCTDGGVCHGWFEVSFPSGSGKAVTRLASFAGEHARTEHSACGDHGTISLIHLLPYAFVLILVA